jgi:predicted nucleic acid-binding protein
MEAVLVDTNIIIDLLAKRPEFYKEAQELFTLADNKEVELFVSALSFANTYYVLSKEYKAEIARKLLMRFKVLVKVLPVHDKIIELALASDFKDFEDAIQYHTAIENAIDIIVTRNKKDFKTGKLPVLTAKEYINR